MKIKKSIRKKILTNMTVVAVTLGIVLVGVMAYFMTSLTNSILLDTLRPMVKIASQGVESNLRMMTERLFFVGENKAFTNPGANTQEKKEALDHAKSGIELVWLALYSFDGELEVSSGEAPGNISSQSIFSLMQKTQNLVIDDIITTSKGLELYIGKPILDSDGTVRYLIGSYRYDVLNDVLSSINVSINATAFIINADGKLMAHRDMNKVLEGRSITDAYDFKNSTNELLNHMVTGETGVMELGEFSEQFLTCFAPVRGTNWSLAIVVPRKDFMAASNQAITISIIITALLLFFAAILTIRMASKIQKQLGRVTKRIVSFADGDLHSPIEVEHTKDETETLSVALSDTVSSINQNTSELSRILSSISQSNLDIKVSGNFQGDFTLMKESLNNIIDFLNRIMSSLQNASFKVSETSHLVSETALEVESNSSSQSESLSMLHQETNMIAKNLDDIDSNTMKVEKLMDQVVGSLNNGEIRMRNMLDAMEAISHNSNEIEDVNKILEGISFQTNILALNASVEAARAGEAGKGFAIVAAEVRKLAAECGESSQRTAEIILNSQSSTKQGSESAEQVAFSIREIMRIANEISEITKELSIAVSSEKESLKNITKQIDEIRIFAGHNLDSSRKSAKASQSLTEEVEVLNEMAEGFKLRDDARRDV